MAFTYIGDLSTDRDRVRFHIRDVVSGDGPLPNDGNFTDAEIDGLLTLHGVWQKAVAGAFEALAGAWQQYADITVGPHRESLSQIANGYRAQAQQWRAMYGSPSAVGSRFVTRKDGYSTDVTADA